MLVGLVAGGYFILRSATRPPTISEEIGRVLSEPIMIPIRRIRPLYAAGGMYVLYNVIRKFALRR